MALEGISIDKIEALAYNLSIEYFPSINEQQAEKIINKIEFIIKSGYYKCFKDKAFNIWYDLTKLHLLSNGNKRMAFACFLLYCDSNNRKPKGNFVKTALFIANSIAEDKENVIKELNKRIHF